MNERRQTIKLLEANGYVFKRQGGNHDVYFNPEAKRMIPVKRHNFDKNTMRYILKEAGIKER